MDDFLERLNAELHRRVDALTDTHRAVAAAEASGDGDAIAQAEATAWQAGLALAELAIGNMARDRLAREIAPLDNQGNDPETEHRRMLMGLGRFMQDVRSIGAAKLSDLVAGDTLRQLNGEEGRVLRPVASGPGRKSFDAIDLHWVRRYVLGVFVACARQTTDNMEEFLAKAQPAPTHRQFRDWSQLVLLHERDMAREIGKALRTGLLLSVDQAVLWNEIKDDDLVKLAGFLLRLDPAKVPAPSGGGC